MIKRRRFKQAATLEERLVQDINQLRDRAKNMKPGAALDQVLQRIRQNEAAAHMNEWLKTPGSQAPR